MLPIFIIRRQHQLDVHRNGSGAYIANFEHKQLINLASSLPTLKI